MKDPYIVVHNSSTYPEWVGSLGTRTYWVHIRGRERKDGKEYRARRSEQYSSPDADFKKLLKTERI